MKALTCRRYCTILVVLNLVVKIRESIILDWNGKTSYIPTNPWQWNMPEETSKSKAIVERELTLANWLKRTEHHRIKKFS